MDFEAAALQLDSADGPGAPSAMLGPETTSAAGPLAGDAAADQGAGRADPQASSPDGPVFEPIRPADPQLGTKMAALGYRSPGRPRIADRFKLTIGKVEEKIANSLEDVFDDYIAELKPKDPEICPSHRRVIQCPRCEYSSQRIAYNHAAAQYLADRIMGRPTSRSESAITIKLSQQLIALFVEAFQAVNALQDATERQIAYADRVEAIEAQYTTS